VQRAGFERMVAEVCLGKVGAVCAREVWRFACNSRDWQQLIEMCCRFGRSRPGVTG
jgi:DNA invertase Pin-like site-specific DNA recombinase